MKAAVICRIQVAPAVARRALVQLRRLGRAAQAMSESTIAEVSLVLVGNGEARRLNRQYRRHDRTTDVLSFAYQTKPMMGELVISWPQAVRQATRHKHTTARELDVLIVHGLLHLLGHDHVRRPERQVMRALELRVLTAVTSV